MTAGNKRWLGSTETRFLVQMSSSSLPPKLEKLEGQALACLDLGTLGQSDLDPRMRDQS